MVISKLKKFLREIYNISPFRKHFFYSYFYLFSPAELCFLCNCIDKTIHLDGDIIEIGCAEGRTTVFLNKHMQFMGYEKNYYAIDTFAGFTRSDLQYEATKRNKDKEAIKVQFVVNKKSWVDKTLKMNGIYNVKTIQADINKINLSSFGIEKIAFALIDVDLYLPVKSALEKVYPLMTKGGIIVVDDCKEHIYFDGALEAYEEFITEKGIQKNIIFEKLGVIYI